MTVELREHTGLKDAWNETLIAWADHALSCDPCFDATHTTECEVGRELVEAQFEAWKAFDESRWVQ